MNKQLHKFQFFQIIEKAREIEKKEHSVFFHKFLGFSCIVMALVFFFFSVWVFKERLKGLFIFIFIGSLALYLGFSEAKELKKLKKELWNENTRNHKP